MLTLSLNMKARLKNKSFWLAMIGAIVLLSQQCGLDISKFIPTNYVDITNTIFLILAMLGIVVDTSTSGISDKVIQDSTVQAIKATETKEEVKAEASTTAINNTVTENSQSTPIENLNASSKIVVDVPVE